MRLIHAPHKGKLVSMAISFDHGSRTDEIHGTAHLMEHCLFLGTKNQNKEQLAKTNALLGDFNASTGRGALNLIATCLESNQRAVVKQFGEMLADSVFPEKPFASEKKVVSQEIHLYDSDPWGTVANLCEDKMFDRSYNILGTDKSLKKITVNEIQKSYDKLHPSNAVLFITGGNEKEAKWARTYLTKKLANKSKEQFSDNDLVLSKPSIRKKSLAIDSCVIACIWHEEKTNLRKHIVRGMVSHFFGSVFDGYLFKKVRDELGAAYAVGACTGMSGKMPYVEMYAQTTADRLSEVKDVFINQAPKVRITQDELEELKTKKKYILHANSQTVESFTGRASKYIKSVGLKTVPTLEEEGKIIDSITLKEVNDAIDKAFQNKPHIFIAGAYKA